MIGVHAEIFGIFSSQCGTSEEGDSHHNATLDYTAVAVGICAIATLDICNVLHRII